MWDCIGIREQAPQSRSVDQNAGNCLVKGRMAALSRFVSASGEKGHPYFQCLRRNNKFVWTKECEEAFVKLKEYLASPPVLCKPLVGIPLRLYFAVTERAVSAVLAHDQD